MSWSPPFEPLSRGKLPQPPAWLRDAVLEKTLLLANHVLRSEPQACERLKTHSGQAVQLDALGWTLLVRVSPAGLLERAADSDAAVLKLRTEWPGSTPFPFSPPAWQVDGNAAMASTFAWLAEHVRWDVEADLARIMGPSAAFRLARAGVSLRDALAAFGRLARRSAPPLA